jgi:hypothetical protein
MVLYHRVILKKMPIFEFSSSYGNFIRPKPVEAMILFGTIYTISNIFLIQYK